MRFRLKSRCSTARLHDAQHRLPLGDAKVARRQLVARQRGGDDSGSGAAILPNSSGRPTRCGSPCSARRRAHRRASEQFIDTTELDFLFDRERHLFAIGYNVTEGRRDLDLLRRIGLRSASRELRRHRHAPRVAGALVQAGPPDDAGRTASRARVVERVDVRVPHAASRHAQLSAHASSRDLPRGHQPPHRIREGGRAFRGASRSPRTTCRMPARIINIARSAYPASG